MNFTGERFEGHEFAVTVQQILNSLIARYEKTVLVNLTVNGCHRNILPENAKRVAERVRSAVEETGFPLKDVSAPLNVTVSIGLAFLRPQEAGSALVNRADAALYASKNCGRNMVTLATAA